MQKMEQLIQFNMFKSMKKVQSAYFFSILLFSSSLVLLMLHSMKSFSILSLFSVTKFNIDRNHVFLICNGILVILVKSSSSSSSSDSSSSDYSSTNSNAVQNNDQCLLQKKPEEIISAVTSEQKIEVTTDVKTAKFSCAEDNCNLVHVHEKVVVSECQVQVHDREDEDEDEDEDEEDHEGAEELNKRCEDFIRKMKQGIISETRKDMGLTRF